MGPRYSPARSPRDSGYDSPGAYMSGGLGPRTRRASLREDILSQHDNGTRKSKSYADTVHPGDSISQVGRPTFVKPGQCVESSPHSRRLEQYEQSSRRGSRDDYGPTSPKSDSRRASYAGEHGAGRHQYKNRYGDNSCVEIGRDPRDFHCSGYGDSRIYQYKNSYGDKAGIEVQMDPVDMRLSGYRDDRSRTSYRGDNGGVVIVRRDITPPGSSSSSNRRSARASSGGASGGAYGRSSRSSGGPSSDSRAQFGRHWKDITYGDNRRFQHYDFRSGVKSHTTPDIGQDGVCGVAARDDSRGTLIVTEGRVNAYVKMPRMVFVECGKQALATFKHVSLERLREYADSIDNHSAPPMPGDRNRRGFWMDPQTLSLMVGRGTVERTVLDVEIAYLGSVSSARSSRAREIQRKRHEGKKDNEDLLRASSRWDSDYEAGRGSSHRRYSQRNIYYQDNDRYGRHY